MRGWSIIWLPAALAALLLVVPARVSGGKAPATGPAAPPAAALLSVSPERVPLTVDRETRSGRVEVTNQGGRELRCEVRLTRLDFTKGPGVLHASPQVTSLVSHIELPVKSLTLAAGEVRFLDFSVTDKGDLLPGTYVTRLEVAAAATGEMLGSALIAVTINSYVSVTANLPQVNGGDVRSVGDFSSTISFHVESNVQTMQLFAMVSPLYKGGAPGETAPIPLDLARGVSIVPANAAAPPGGTLAAFSCAGPTLSGFPTQQTAVLTFECGPNARFAQDVFVTVWWNNERASRPRGQYAGALKLVTLLMP